MEEVAVHALNALGWVFNKKVEPDVMARRASRVVLWRVVVIGEPGCLDFNEVYAPMVTADSAGCGCSAGLGA